MGTPLTSATVASTYQALIKTSTNAPLTALRRLSDGLGNDSSVYLSSTQFNNRGAGNLEQNTSIGENALQANTTGAGNIAIGLLSLSSVTTGNANTSIGMQSQQSATGSDNTSLGYQSLSSATGQYNIAIGSAAAQSALGNRNIIIGSEACTSATGSDNVVLGHQANTSTFSNCVLLGRATSATTNNQFVVGTALYNVGLIATESLTPTASWAIRINGTNYKIPLQVA
jgi:hypothetical protein